MSVHRCLWCGKPITWTFALCANCEKIYGNKYTEWPQWLKFLWSDIQKTRRLYKKVKMTEVSIELIDRDSIDDSGTDSY